VTDLRERAITLLRTHVEPAAGDASQLGRGRNDVVRVPGVSGQEYVVKLYRPHPATHIGNIEPVAYRHLSGAAGIRRCFAAGTDFLITEFLPGTTVLEAIQSGGIDTQALSSQLAGFLRTCAAVSVTGFGEPDAALHGGSTSWPEHLRSYLELTERRLATLPSATAGPLRASWEAARDYLTAEETSLANVAPALVPIDLNLANLLLAPDGRLTVLDLETFWLADPLLALGEWTAHTYGSDLHSAVLTAWHGEQSASMARRVRFYALLATLDIQLFVAESDGGTDPENACPWGNPLSFGQLAAVHRHALADPAPLPESLAHALPVALSGWGAKTNTNGRSGSPQQTLDRLNHVRSLAGITRVADITALDRTGIFVSQSMRPAAETAPDTFTVFSGRGTTLVDSQIAAIAEGVERHCGERGQFDPGRLLTGTAREAAEAGRVIGPERFNLPADAEYGPATRLEWAPATDVLTGMEWLVPACAVFYPYTPPEGCAAPLRYFTTGLAAGMTLLEALAHGFAEIAERDAAALNRIVRGSPAVRISSIHDPVAREQIERLQGAGLDVIVRWITAPDVGVPVFSVICADRSAADARYVSGGYGAHPDKSVALTRAVQEAAASRVGTISGAREDLAKFRNRGNQDYADFQRRYAYWFDASSPVDYSTLPGRRLPTVLDDLTFVVRAFHSTGFPQVLYVDLSRDELGVPVLKALVPGVERYSFHMRCVGVRARRMYRERYGRELPLPQLYENCGNQ
jgi:thioglycine synthase